jgi:Icc-related predicted phosphoesterase
MSKTKIFFASDLHGSERCWRKFLNSGRHFKANVIIMGGDITGKLIVPIVEQAGGVFSCKFQQAKVVHAGRELEELEGSIKNMGYYPVKMSPEELRSLADPKLRDELFKEVMLTDLRRWLDIAEEKLKGTGIRCFISPGNDDIWEVDEILKSQSIVEVPDGHRIVIDDEHEMIGVGWSTPTPWHTERECTEEAYAKKIDRLVTQVEHMETAIFDFHCPPYGTGLDNAPALSDDLKAKTILGQPDMQPVGSHAVRDAIQEYQPLLGLHGHIHESKGLVRLGRTLCVNPGSEYTEGVLCGSLLGLNGTKVEQYQLITG